MKIASKAIKSGRRGPQFLRSLHVNVVFLYKRVPINYCATIKISYSLDHVDT